jgi:predicted kinase
VPAVPNTEIASAVTQWRRRCLRTALARRLLWLGRTRSFMRQFLYLLCGPSLAGKSSACRQMVTRLSTAVVSADVINEGRGLPFGGEGLPDSVWADTLRLQIVELERCAAQGSSVILDDTLCYRWLRNRFREEGQRMGLSPRLLVFSPSRPELLARHALAQGREQRPVLSMSRFLQHLESFEWPSADEPHVDLTNPEKFSAWLQAEAVALQDAT